jgi:hypothetical protein
MSDSQREFFSAWVYRRNGPECRAARAVVKAKNLQPYPVPTDSMGEVVQETRYYVCEGSNLLLRSPLEE